MKKIFLTSIIAVFLSFGLFAQRYAYVDTQYILENMPDYVGSQAELDRIAIEWQKEIEAKFANIDQLYKKYQADAPLLPEDMKQRREDEIINAEKEAKDLQKKRFGNDGDLYKKREELMKPIQDRVFNAIEEFSRSKNYAFVFDKSGALTIIYADPKNDISNDIMDKLGITPTN
ncbi:MAG: OmpH family outer membrane protein [Bacteroidales bacterium]|jgi:outer membrane protein|nr:OmpH family outer membrane protein [Bacteroidales bacterium]